MGKRGPKRKQNDYTVHGDTVYMIVGHKVILFDKCDLEKVIAHRWNMCGDYVITQVYRNNKQHTIYLHRYILGIVGNELQVDHINGDTLDCRRRNLRPCTQRENAKNKKKSKNNKTGVAGVILRKDCKHNPYMAKICVDGKQMCLGHFPTLEAAAEARRKAEQMYFGEFRRDI